MYFHEKLSLSQLNPPHSLDGLASGLWHLNSSPRLFTVEDPLVMFAHLVNEAQDSEDLTTFVDSSADRGRVDHSILILVDEELINICELD